MIEERAVVRAVRDGVVWVQAYATQDCERCRSGHGCGGGLLGRLAGLRQVEIRADNAAPDVRVGDAVVVGIREGELLSASALVYLVPLAGMFGAGLLAHHVLHAHELVVALFALAGLAGSFAGLRAYSGRAELAHRYRPVVLRKDTSAARDCARL